ncbi:tRNA lysidine(34) synthetase TilS [Lactobacillaceae bacterium L1_55_11]|nr:tRNA lysidine(34) synthetase TilS [Lactobacillaceae bacterium L1_55_11]
MTDILRTIKQDNWPKRVIIGVSGGVDSVVLLQAFCKAQPGVQVTVAHVNYHFRPESDQDAAFVADLAQRLGVGYQQVDYDPQKGDGGAGLEGRARDFRYQFFTDLAHQQGAGAILVAHQADDQAETVLLNLIRGGQLAQLAGMIRSRPLIRRPLLNFSRAEILTFARGQQLSWREDVTNQDPDYTARNRLRLDILPALAELNAGAVDHINDFARQIADQQAVIDAAVKPYLSLVANHWDQIPVIWRPATLKAWLNQAGFYQLKETQLKPLLNFLDNSERPNGYYDLGQGYQLVKSYQKIALNRGKNFTKKSQDSRAVMLKLNEQEVFAGHPIIWTDQRPKAGKKAIAIKGLSPEKSLTLRYGRPNDYLPFAGGHQSLRRLLINEKVPAQLRNQVWVLTQGDQDQLIALGLPSGKWRFSSELADQVDPEQQWLVW